jgi:hypothetical protein
MRHADHTTPFHPQKLALTSPTIGNLLVGIVRSRTKATGFSFVVDVTVLLPGEPPVLEGVWGVVQLSALEPAALSRGH